MKSSSVKKNAYQQLQGGLRIDFDSSICIHRVFGITFLHSLTFWSCSYHLKVLKKLNIVRRGSILKKACTHLSSLNLTPIMKYRTKNWYVE